MSNWAVFYAEAVMRHKPKADIGSKQMTELERTRKQYVAKRNDMIQKSKNSLGVVERKAVAYVLSKVKPDDNPNTVYAFDCQEFYQLMRWKKESYTELRAMLYNIANQTFGLIDEETGTEKIVHWFNTIHLIKQPDGKIVYDGSSELSGRYVEIKIHEDIMPYVFDLEKQKREKNLFYTAYYLQNVSMLSQMSSQTLYELLKSYENVQNGWRSEYGTGTENDIQTRLAVYTQESDQLEETRPKGKGGRKRKNIYRRQSLVPIIPKSWSNFAVFRRDVLDPAMHEINLYTDIEFRYEASKVDINGVRRRKYSTITFYIRKKTPAQREETDQIIDDAYKDFDNGKLYKQLNINDFLDGIIVDEEEEEKAKKKEAKKEKEIESAQYQVAASVFYDSFKQKEITSLVEAAIKHIRPMRVRQADKEMWAIDFISYYYDKIRATEDDTRTTPYRRLLDSVIKDYDGFAEQLTTYDSIQFTDAAYRDVDPEAELDAIDGYPAADEQAPESGDRVREENSGPESVPVKKTMEELYKEIAELKRQLEMIERNRGL